MKANKAKKIEKKKNKKNPLSYIKRAWREKNEGVKYWLNRDSFENLKRSSGMSLEKTLSLYTIKNTISNFVRITSKKSVNVKYFGNDSMTDGNTVYISANLDDFDTVVGLALHESSHLEYSVCNIYKMIYDKLQEDHKKSSNTHYGSWSNEAYEFVNEYYKILRPYYDKPLVFRKANDIFITILKSLINWVEDRRIDNLIATKYPGYVQYYEKLYSHYFYNEKVGKALQSNLYREPSYDSYEFRILNSINPAADPDALPSLDKIYDLLRIDNIAKCKTNWETAYLALRILAIILQNIVEPKQPKQPEQNGQGQSNENNNDSEQKNKGNSDSNQNESNDSKQEDGDSDQDSQSNKQDADDDNDTSGSDNDDDSDDDSDSNDDSSDDNDDSDSNDTDDDADGDDDGLSDGEREILKDAVESIMGSIRDLLSQEDSKLKDKLDNETVKKIALLDSKSLEIAHTTDTKVPSDVLILNKITPAIKKSFPNLFDHYYTSPETIKLGINQGHLLGKRLSFMNDERFIKSIRKENGRLDQRLLPEIGFGNTRVFSSIRTEEYKKLYVHLTLDQSGSMGGRPWQNTLRMAATLVTALSYLENVRVVVTSRATNRNSNAGTENPYCLTMYDSSVDKIQHIIKEWPHLRATGNTPEGLVFDALREKILNDAQGTDAYFINVSDGEPSCSSTGFVRGGESWKGDLQYRYDDALTHTKKQVDILVKNDITVISFLITDAKFHHSFNKMYGKYAHYINVLNITALANVLNKRFTLRNSIVK